MAYAAISDSPSRLARRNGLNTIMEDKRGEIRAEERQRQQLAPRSVSPVPSLTSSISSYYFDRRSGDFSETMSEIDSAAPSIVTDLSSVGSASPDFAPLKHSKPRYPTLDIPSPRSWPAVPRTQQSPPRPPKVPLSPANLSLLGNDLSRLSSPPSLAESASTDPTNTYSGPSTPVSQTNGRASDIWGAGKSQKPKITVDTTTGIAPQDHVSTFDFATQESSDVIETGVGVELPFDALMTLQHLSLEQQSPKEVEAPQEMLQTYSPIARSENDSPVSQISEYSLSNLSIPSPTDFFASLGKNARHSWNMEATPASEQTPTSPAAEQYYQGTSDAAEAYYQQCAAPSLHVQEEDYEKIITEAMEKNADRTSDWLAAQTSYLSALRETNPVNDLSTAAEAELKRASIAAPKDAGLKRQKTVRFAETPAVVRGQETNSGDAIFYEAFQHISSAARKSDAFRHQLTRSDSIQSVRLCMPHEHVNRLKGECQIDQPERPNPPRPISLMPGKSSEDETPEQCLIQRVERERQALEQINARAWIIEANKYLSGGSLLNSPARWKTIKTPKLGDIQNGRVKNPARILDLGGVPNGDWAWHCSREFPHAKIYTATTDVHLVDEEHSIRGPSNCRRVGVKKLWDLPFPDNHFHAISARNVQQYLKTTAPEGTATDSGKDEYDILLKECMRVLKPGGYLEFALMDAEPVSTGPLGTQASVEFAYNLKTRGFDPAPTKPWLSKLKAAGFDDIKRAWTVMPMGSPTASAEGPREVAQPPELPPNKPTFDAATGFDSEGKTVEAVRGPLGSTAGVANLAGMVGSWSWEQWMLRLEMEMGREGRFLNGVAGVLEEGKQTGAGWRCLKGWARKPFDLVEKAVENGNVAGAGARAGYAREGNRISIEDWSMNVE